MVKVTPRPAGSNHEPIRARRRLRPQEPPGKGRLVKDDSSVFLRLLYSLLLKFREFEFSTSLKLLPDVPSSPLFERTERRSGMRTT